MNNIGAGGKLAEELLAETKMRTSWLSASLALASLASVSPQLGYADVPTFTATGTATDGQSLSAQATFTFGGTLAAPTLTLVLTDNQTTELDTQGNLLSALFFSLSGTPVLTYKSATASTSINSSDTLQGTDVNFDSYWNYSSAPGKYGASYGVGSVGLGIPGFKGGCCAGEVAGSAGVDGKDAGFKTKNGPWAENAVTFVFDLPKGTVTSGLSVSDVTFQYGTALSDGHLTGTLVPTPEPSSVLLLFTTLIAIVGGASLTRVYRRSHA